MLMRLKGTLEEVVRVVESLYDINASREELYERRHQAWELYLELVGRMAMIPQWANDQLALRACVLVFITRMAMERQAPAILAQWHVIGD